MGLPSSPYRQGRRPARRTAALLVLTVALVLGGSLVRFGQAGAPPESPSRADSLRADSLLRAQQQLADSLATARLQAMADSLAQDGAVAENTAASGDSLDNPPTEPEPADDASDLPASHPVWAFRVTDTGSTVAVTLPPDSLYPVPFGPGERLRYWMEFSFVRAGLSEMAISGVDTVLGRPVYSVRSRVKSTRGIDLIYKVRDTVRSWFDVGGLYSHRYERDIREGSYRSKKYFDYDHRTGWVSISNENGPKGTSPFLPFSHNIMSALYWVRAQELEVDSEIVLPLHDLDTQYPLTVKVYGRETIEVPAGTFDCIKVEPVIESEGLFKKAGRLYVWLTDDEHRLPVRMSTEISVGTVDGNLVEYRLGEPIRPGETPARYPEDEDWDW